VLFKKIIVISIFLPIPITAALLILTSKSSRISSAAFFIALTLMFAFVFTYILLSRRKIQIDMIKLCLKKSYTEDDQDLWRDDVEY